MSIGFNYMKNRRLYKKICNVFYKNIERMEKNGVSKEIIGQLQAEIIGMENEIETFDRNKVKQFYKMLCTAVSTKFQISLLKKLTDQIKNGELVDENKLVQEPEIKARRKVEFLLSKVTNAKVDLNKCVELAAKRKLSKDDPEYIQLEKEYEDKKREYTFAFKEYKLWNETSKRLEELEQDKVYQNELTEMAEINSVSNIEEHITLIQSNNEVEQELISRLDAVETARGPEPDLFEMGTLDFDKAVENLLLLEMEKSSKTSVEYKEKVNSLSLQEIMSEIEKINNHISKLTTQPSKNEEQKIKELEKVVDKTIDAIEPNKTNNETKLTLVDEVKKAVCQECPDLRTAFVKIRSTVEDYVKYEMGFDLPNKVFCESIGLKPDAAKYDIFLKLFPNKPAFARKVYKCYTAGNTYIHAKREDQMLSPDALKNVCQTAINRAQFLHELGFENVDKGPASFKRIFDAEMKIFSDSLSRGTGLLVDQNSKEFEFFIQRQRARFKILSEAGIEMDMHGLNIDTSSPKSFVSSLYKLAGRNPSPNNESLNGK